MHLLSPFKLRGRDYVITGSRGTSHGLPIVSYFVSLGVTSPLLSLVWDATTNALRVDFQGDGFEAGDLDDIKAHVMLFVPGRVSGLKGGALAPLLTQLRTVAAALPESDQAVALEHIEKLEEHAAKEEPDTLRMKIILKGLEVFGPLVPYIGPIFNSLSNVGA
jgi:hypothetical protein